MTHNHEQPSAFDQEMLDGSRAAWLASGIQDPAQELAFRSTWVAKILGVDIETEESFKLTSTTAIRPAERDDFTAQCIKAMEDGDRFPPERWPYPVNNR